MGETAERLAELHAIGREEQDEFALRSQERAAKALTEGRFDTETFPVVVAGKKGASSSGGTSIPAPTRPSPRSPGSLRSSSRTGAV